MSEPGGNLYKLTLKGAGISVDREILEPQALEVMALVMGGSAPTKPPEGSVGMRTPERILASTTVGEYITEVGATNNTEKILAIAAFLADHLGQEQSTREEVRAQFQHAGEPLPSNIARDFQTVVSKRWLAVAPGSPGSYFVTNTGRIALTDGFATARPRPRKTAKRAAKKATPAKKAAAAVKK